MSTPYRHYDPRRTVRRDRGAIISRASKPSRRAGVWGRKPLWGWALTIGAATLLAGTIAFIGVVAWVSHDLPDPNNLHNRNIAQTTRIYDRTGKVVLYEIFGGQKRTIVELDQISEYVKEGTVAAEDKDFYTHAGFDARGMMRAMRNNLLNPGGRLQSGSTITQQFVKKSILSDEQTLVRKFKEIILSLEIERRFSKDEILKLYLNEIPYGAVSYGIESASQTFFGKSANELTLSEAALLVSLPKGPTYYSPYGTHTDALIERQHYVLDSMVREGFITAEEAEEAKKDDILPRIKPKKDAIVAPHFVFYVKEQLAEQFGESVVERGGLKVITTLNADHQAAAEKEIEAGMPAIEKYDGNSAALLSLDAKTGDILAMVGSADYFNDEINGKFNSWLSRLQPGSSIKPAVYAAAFEKGFTPNTVVYDVKTTFKNNPSDYTPVNYDGGERGPVTLKQALAGSLNIPAVKTLYLVGIEPFIAFAKKMGYTTFDSRKIGLSLVLGGAEVDPIEHVAAFTAFARDGQRHSARALLKVEDASGAVLYDAEQEENEGENAFDPQVARQINDILSDNAARAYVFGENNFLTLGNRPVAAKTGTTNRFKDAWTVGYTPSIVTGVWVGHSRGETMKTGADGSKVAAPIWNKYMRAVLEGTPVESFAAPEPVVTGKPILDGDRNAQASIKIDTITGKLATEHTPPELVEERKFGVPHSILFFVDKDDPRGEPPADPNKDPQFENWERGIAEWALKQNIVITDAPTEYDDVHVPENVPTVTFITPSEGGTVTDRMFSPAVSASARRGVREVQYAIDGETIGRIAAMSGQPISIPNRFGKGFHTFTATAFDDVGNRGSTSITINLTAEPGPLGIQWKTLYPFMTAYSTSFPLRVAFDIEDHKSIAVLVLTATAEGTDAEELIGSIDHPPLPSVSFNWAVAPPRGRYLITVNAKLTTGETRTESIAINVL